MNRHVICCVCKLERDHPAGTMPLWMTSCRRCGEIDWYDPETKRYVDGKMLERAGFKTIEGYEP